MSIENITINGIKYIKETFPNGSVSTYPDPEFQDDSCIPLLPAPDLSNTNKKLDFIIKKFRLLTGHEPPTP